MFSMSRSVSVKTEDPTWNGLELARCELDAIANAPLQPCALDDGIELDDADPPSPNRIEGSIELWACDEG